MLSICYLYIYMLSIIYIDIYLLYIFIQVSTCQNRDFLDLWGLHPVPLPCCPLRRPVDIWVVGAPQDSSLPEASSNRINQDPLPHFSRWNPCLLMVEIPGNPGNPMSFWLENRFVSVTTTTQPPRFGRLSRELGSQGESSTGPQRFKLAKFGW